MEEQLFGNNQLRKKKSIGLIHKVYLAQLKTSRKYTASTKTKSEVRGGGRKPWKQKGTGQARAGSTRSPLWRGGGVAFGPHPRVVNKKINKKERRLAVLSALYLKRDSLTFVIDTFFEQFQNQIKTKLIELFLKEAGFKPNEQILFIIPEPNKEFWLATRNMRNVEITVANCLNLKQLLKAQKIVVSKTSLELIHLTYGTSYA